MVVLRTVVVTCSHPLQSRLPSIRGRGGPTKKKKCSLMATTTTEPSRNQAPSLSAHHRHPTLNWHQPAKQNYDYNGNGFLSKKSGRGQLVGRRSVGLRDNGNKSERCLVIPLFTSAHYLVAPNQDRHDGGMFQCKLAPNFMFVHTLRLK